MGPPEEHQMVSPADVDSPAHPFPSGDNIPGAGRSPAGLVLAFFLIGLTASLLAGWLLFPKLLYSRKEQPVTFDHARHLKVVADGCRSCHFFRPDGTFSGVPSLARCAGCHHSAPGSSPAETAFIKKYVSGNRQVPWLIYAGQPGFVFFSHAAHVKGAKMQCGVCHGNIGHSRRLPVYEVNRITGYSRDIEGAGIMDGGRTAPDRPRLLTMSDCESCHLKETGSKGACFQCHM